MKKERFFSVDITEFLFLLAKRRVRYLIVGGEAVIYYGHARLTGDIDLFYDTSAQNVTRLWAALKEFWHGVVPGIQKEEKLMDRGMIMQFGVPPHRIDLIGAITGVRFGEAWKKKRKDILLYRQKEFAAYYIGLDDLIRNKKAVNRAKDKDDLIFLKEARKKLKGPRTKDNGPGVRSRVQQNMNLLSKLENKSFTVGVVGLGYVGLPLLHCFVEKGLSVFGFDIDRTKVKQLAEGKSYIKHISSERVKRAVNSGRAKFTTDYAEMSKCDAILICVPTPLNKNREPDLTFIVSTCEAIVPHLRKDQLIVLESTTYPGTTEEVVIPILEKSGLKADKDFFVAFSPEREDPNNPKYTTETIPKVVGSTSPEGLEVANKLYQQIVVKTVPVSSAKVAEATKLMENIFRSVNIALVNELKVTFMRMGIDIWEVIEAAKTKPFGYMPFYPGPGLGGHCIPIDPFYLTWKAREYGVTTKFIELAGEINSSMPDFVVRRVMEALNDVGKPLKGSKILLLGLAYKANIDDDRESPSYHLMQKLEEKGAVVSYNDPYVPEIKLIREFPKYAGKKSVPITRDYDAMIIATAHDEYKSLDFSQYKMPVVDTRNVARNGTVVKA